MKKNILVFLFTLLVSSSVAFAQTFTERQEIISNYDLDKLAQMEAAYTAEFAVEKEEAMRLAAIYGWEEIIELPNGGIAMLVGVFENGSPKYLTTTTEKEESQHGQIKFIRAEALVWILMVRI